MWEGNGGFRGDVAIDEVFRAPVAVSSDAAWRDRFLALTGRLP